MQDIDVVTQYFQALNYWDWLGIALLLLVFEIVVSGTFFMWMAGSAAVVALVVWVVPGIDWKMQTVLFSVLSVVSIVLWKKYSRDSSESQSLGLNKRGHGYIGKTYTLSSPVERGVGRLVIDDTSWSVEGDDAIAGEKVTVVAVEGMILKVKKIVEK
jgi:membrane protein implicated in regulation of membrane protease activity